MSRRMEELSFWVGTAVGNAMLNALGWGVNRPAETAPPAGFRSEYYAEAAGVGAFEDDLELWNADSGGGLRIGSTMLQHYERVRCVEELMAGTTLDRNAARALLAQHNWNVSMSVWELLSVCEAAGAGGAFSGTAYLSVADVLHKY